jgi:signal transduction histidine kinase
MMNRTFSIFQNKTILKFLLAILIFLIFGSIFFLLKSSKNEPHCNKKDNNKHEVRKLLAKGDIYFDTYRYNEAYYYFNKAQLLCDTKVNYIEYVYALTCIANIEQAQGDFAASEASLTKTLPYLKKIKKPRFAANVYEQYASNYYYTYDYNNSLLYQIKALHLKSSNFRKVVVLNSISLNYLKQKKFKLAEEILVPLSKIKTIIKDHKDLNDSEHSRILDNLGLCYFEQDRPESLKYFEESLTIKLRLQDYTGLIYCYMHLAAYYEKRNPSLSKTYAKNAYSVSSKLNDASNKIHSLDLLIRTSEGNDLKKYALQFIQLVDSVNKAKHSAKNQFSRIKYDAKKDRFENLHLKSQKAENQLHLERQKKRNIVSYIIIICTSILSLFLYLHLTLKARKEKNKEIYQSEMRISKKLHDELANEVYKTLAFAENKDLQQEENKEYFLNNLDTLYSKTRKISKENSFITTSEFYQVALREMISEFKTPDVNILLNGMDTVSWNKIDKNKKITLYRVLQELFLNMKKHSKATLASTIFKMNDQNLTVIYTDNGVGIDNNRLILKSGLQNVESRIKTINGTITFDNNSKKGFKLSFTFPL